MRNSPVFNARQISNLSFDKLYRIFLVGDTLYFIRIGGQDGIWGGLTHQLGLLGLLLESSMRKRAERKEKALIEAIDRTDPERLLPTHGDNFRLSATELQEGTVDPPWLLATHGPHVGRCRLVLRNGTTMNFQFEKTEDMLVALDALSGLLASRLQLNVRWNEIKRRFEKGDHTAWRPEES